MKNKWLFAALVVLVVVACAGSGVRAETRNMAQFSAGERGLADHPPRSSGGPDGWGYIFVDSDPPEPTITYSWIDLQATGWSVDTIPGLGDDNVVGPFPIGFEFPYYWYHVDEFYVGSNGYLSFSDNMLEAAPFVQYPKVARPNDVLGIFTDDLEFGSPAAPQAICFMATNPAADTCVITYENVPFWAVPTPTGNNTFQIVLSKADSTIRYQYYEQTGSGSSSNTRSVGWEDRAGRWGYSYLFGSNPPANNIHAGLAVAIYDTATNEPPFHDIGVEAVMSENSGGCFAEWGEPLPVWAEIANRGSRDEHALEISMRIEGASGQPVLEETRMIPELCVEEVDTLLFTEWVPVIEGVYTVAVENLLTGDEYPSNDLVEVECHVVSLPATFSYCDETFVSGVGW